MSHKISEPYTLDRVIRLLISTLSVAGGLYLLYALKDVLLPFFIAWLVAYILNPVVRFLRKKLRIANSLAVIITLLACAGALILMIAILMPIIGEELDQIKRMIDNYRLQSINPNDIPPDFQAIINQFVDFKELQQVLSKKSIMEIVQYLSPAFREIFSSTVSFLVGVTVVFIIMLYLIFILLDYEKINDFWRLLIPPKYREIVSRVSIDVEGNMNKYFRHQALICAILAVFYAIGFQLIGLPMAIVFGILVGIIHMVPYLQVVSFPPAILLCWLRASQTEDGFWVMIGLTILVYVVVQCIMDLFLVPKIMGKAMGLNPAIILLSLSIWGTLFGIIGMIIAIPLTTLLLSYYRGFLNESEIKIREKQEQSNVLDTISKE